MFEIKDLGYEFAEIHTIPEIMTVGYKMYLSYGFEQQEEIIADPNKKG